MKHSAAEAFAEFAEKIDAGSTSYDEGIAGAVISQMMKSPLMRQAVTDIILHDTDLLNHIVAAVLRNIDITVRPRQS